MIYVFVEGGIVQGVYGPRGQRVCVVDYDADHDDEVQAYLHTIDGHDCYVYAQECEPDTEIEQAVFGPLQEIIQKTLWEKANQ